MLEIKNTVTKMKNAFYVHINGVNIAEQAINKIEDKAMETSQT